MNLGIDPNFLSTDLGEDAVVGFNPKLIRTCRFEMNKASDMCADQHGLVRGQHIPVSRTMGNVRKRLTHHGISEHFNVIDVNITLIGIGHCKTRI